MAHYGQAAHSETGENYQLFFHGLLTVKGS